MVDKSFTVCIALIHNNNELRNDYLRPQLERLLNEVGQNISIEKFEVSHQSNVASHSTIMAFARDIMYRILNREWLLYRRLTPLGLFRDSVGFLKGSLLRYVTGPVKDVDLWKRNSAIETMVTDKHIRAWGRFLETDAKFLICFEDDVVFKIDSIQRLNGLVSKLVEAHPSTACYVDLGGGCQLNELLIDRLEKKQDESYRYYSKPVTNTACAYLINRQLVAIFYTFITRMPWLRLIGIDWMMNKIFILMAREGVECVCMHADSTVFEHGTTTGAYISWQAVPSS